MENVNPTTELMAKYFYDLFIKDYPQNSCNTYSETPKKLELRIENNMSERQI